MCKLTHELEHTKSVMQIILKHRQSHIAYVTSLKIMLQTSVYFFFLENKQA